MIARLFGTAHDERCVYFRLEAITVGGAASVQLRHVLRAQPRRTLPTTPLACVAGCVLGALAYLHSRRVIHRDVKPENLVLGSDGLPRLVDFGHALLLGSPSIEGQEVETEGGGPVRGTAPYAAPELVARVAHGAAVDSWAAGVLIHEALHGIPPPAASTADAATPPSQAAATTSHDDAAVEAAAQLTDALLQLQPSARATTAVASEHGWLRELGWAASQVRCGRTEPWLASAAARAAAAGNGGAEGVCDLGVDLDGEVDDDEAREAAAWEEAEREELLERGKALRRQDPSRWDADFEQFARHETCASWDGG